MLEVWFVLKLMNVLSEGCYYLKHAEIEDFVRHLEDVEVEENTDGLTYLVVRNTVSSFSMHFCFISLFCSVENKD